MRNLHHARSLLKDIIFWHKIFDRQPVKSYRPTIGHILSSVKGAQSWPVNRSNIRPCENRIFDRSLLWTAL